MDPLEAAQQRIDDRAAAPARRAASDATEAALVPGVDPDIDALISSFLTKVPTQSAEELLHRWREERTETHFPPAGVFRRRRKRFVPLVVKTWTTEVVDHGWPLRRYGVQVKVRPSDEKFDDAFVRHTVAITTSGGLLLAAVREGGAVVVRGDASEGRPGYPSPRLGRLFGARTVPAALNEQFPERGPIVGTSVMQTPFTYQESPRYDPMFDFRGAHLRALGEAMVEALREISARRGTP